MSDAAIASIVTGVVTIVTIVVSYLKLKYQTTQAKHAAKAAVDRAGDAVEKAEESARVVSNKIDYNTALTADTKEAAIKVSEHTAGCDEERKQLLKSLADHDGRISFLEKEIITVKMSVETLSKNIDSTRHEIRSNMQSLANKLDIMATMVAKKPAHAD